MKQKQRKPKPNSRPPQKKVPVRKKRRRRGRNLLYYIMFTMIAVAVGLILSLTVFFKIETIEAEGLTHYTPEEVIQTTGIQLEDNLFRVDDPGKYPRRSPIHIPISNRCSCAGISPPN